MSTNRQKLVTIRHIYDEKILKDKSLLTHLKEKLKAELGHALLSHIEDGKEYALKVRSFDEKINEGEPRGLREIYMEVKITKPLEHVELELKVDNLNPVKKSWLDKLKFWRK